MNLEKLLAANMIRFGVKNLNEQLRKTLLNEGLKPGDKAEIYYGPFDYSKSEYAAELSKKLQAYPKGMVQAGAILSTAVGVSNLIKKDKKLQKLMAGITVNQIFNLFTGEISGVTTEDQNLIPTLIETAGNVGYEKTEVSVYPPPKGTGSWVATMGQTYGGSGVNDSSTQKSTTYKDLVNYLNGFNLENVLAGDFTQYRLSEMVDQANYVNLMKAGSAVNTVIVYTKSTKAPNEAGKEISTQNVGAVAPIDKVYDVNFTVGVATIPANDPEVAKAVKDAIAMFPDGNISNLSIVSSASPEFNEANGGPSTMADYGQNTTGVGNPGAGRDDISKNKKLAYDRGVSFIAAINAGLVAQGKPEISNPTINWQIADKGGLNPASKGRFSNVLWSKAGAPGKDVTNMQNTGKAGDVTSGKETFTIFQHVFTCVS